MVISWVASAMCCLITFSGYLHKVFYEVLFQFHEVCGL